MLSVMSTVSRRSGQPLSVLTEDKEDGIKPQLKSFSPHQESGSQGTAGAKGTFMPGMSGPALSLRLLAIMCPLQREGWECLWSPHPTEYSTW